jgi:hypothetical protein
MGLYERDKTAVMVKYGDAFITHTRNILAQRFLASTCEWAMWLDGDMVVPFGNAALFNHYTRWKMDPKWAGIHTLNRLLSHGKTLVGGLYFGRVPDGNPMFCEGIADPQVKTMAKNAPADLVLPTRWVATGCMLVHRSVFESIMTKFPTLAPQTTTEAWHFFSNSETALAEAVENAMRALVDRSKDEPSRIRAAMHILATGKEEALRNSRLQQGEDVTFCKRALEAGHQPYVDLGVFCGHIGDAVFPTGR